MADLHLQASVRGGQITVGGPLVVEATLTNASASEPALVQAKGGLSRFEYELFSKSEGAFTISRVLYDQKSVVHAPPPPAEPRQKLAPGASASYVEDAAAYWVRAAPPGDYELTVWWRGFDGAAIAAPPVRVRIVPLRPGATAQTVERTGVALEGAFVHKGDSGDVVFAREGARGQPALGRVREWHRLASGAAVQGVSVATEVDDPVSWRWIVWLEGGMVAGAAVWADTRMRALDPSPHGLDNAALLPTAWQMADGAGVFPVLGERGGAAVLDVVHAVKGAPVRHHLVDLGTAPPLATVAGLWASSPDTIELLRADAAGAGVAIGRQRVDLTQTRASGVATVVTVPGPLLALGLAPVLGAEAVVDVLAGGAPGAPPTLTFMRLPLTGAAAAKVWTLEPPAQPEGAPARAVVYSLSPTPHPAAPILAQLGSELWAVCAAQGQRWSLVAESHHGIAQPRLQHMTVPDGSDPPNVLYATWFDPFYGFSAKQVGVGVSA